MNILVIGDIMLDINYNSIINRTAPEANIPIYNINDVNYILGGASNVTQNLNYLGINVELISVIGNDYYGEIMKKILNDKQIQYHIFDDLRKTTQKHRIFNNNKISVRYDIEDTFDISTELSSKIMSYIMNKQNIDAIVISDYNKGLLTTQLCKEIIDYANKNNIYTFVDPKIKNVEKYKNCFCFKPNMVECKAITELNESELNEKKKQCLLAIDAEILRLYDLPPRLEKKLLDFFEGVPRKGVDFKFDRYYPAGFDSYIPLHVFISEEFKNSTVENVTKWVEENRTPAVLEALKKATEDFKGE